METRKAQLVARQLGGEIEIGNDRIRARFVLIDGGYAQEFYAADRGGGSFRLLLSSIHKNLIPASEHRTCASPMIAGERPHLFGISREALRMVYSTAEIVRHDEHAVTARLSGAVQGHTITCEVTIESDSNTAHLIVTDEIQRGANDPLVEYLMSSYAFMPDGRELRVGEDIDYAWAPNLRPGDDHVIGDWAFHSPAVIVQKGPTAVAILPDLEHLAENRAMPCSLDLDLRNGLLPAPLLSYGFCGYERTPDGRYCRHDITMAKRLPTHRLSYAYDLLLSADCKPMNAYRLVARFLWDRYGQATLEAWTDHPRPVSFNPPDVEPDAWAARGLHALGDARSDQTILRAARALHEMSLSVPPNGGLFPTRFDRASGEWSGCRIGPNGSRYHTAECSVQLSWMLRWYVEVNKDPQIIRRARAYADFLISSRLRGGAIPSWFGDGQTPIAPLKSSAETAASALFLAELASVTGLVKYIRAAEQSAGFVLKEILPNHAFADSICLTSASDTDLPAVDPHSGARPHGGWALLWTARMCLELHTLTGYRRYLDDGLKVLDQMCLLQSVGIKPWARDRGMPGICVRSNAGVEYDADLSAEFARCAMDYGAITGEHEYFQRGAAALAAANRKPTASALSRARVEATTALIRSRYGSIYVHVGRKWAVSIAGPKVSRLELAPGMVGIEAAPATNGFRGSKVVFAGMRGRSYRVTINGRCEARTREELEAGIPLPEPEHPSSDNTPSPPTPEPRKALGNLQLSFDT